MVSCLAGRREEEEAVDEEKFEACFILMVPADVVAAAVAVVVPTFVLSRIRPLLNIKKQVDDSLECKQNKQGHVLGAAMFFLVFSFHYFKLCTQTL